jgi:RNA polymerase sigma factor (sigma-70 family)
MATALQNISPGLIHHAQLGNKESMDLLVEVVKDRLRAYIYRLTLDANLTEDLLQETILFMLQSLNQLEHAEGFWHWLLRTAMGKVQHHYREMNRIRNIEKSEPERLRASYRAAAASEEGLTELLRKELSEAVFKAMERLKLKHRNVLILRCF